MSLEDLYAREGMVGTDEPQYAPIFDCVSVGCAGMCIMEKFRGTEAPCIDHVGKHRPTALNPDARAPVAEAMSKGATIFFLLF